MNIERKISRREFLIGAGLTIIAAGCKRAEEKLPVVAMEPSITREPTKLPTEKPTDAPTPKPTQTLRPTAVPTVPTPEATATPEPKRISATTITQEYLKSAFAGIGGGEMVEGEKEKMSVVEFGQKYVSDAWGEEVDFRNLPESPIASLKYLVSLGSYRGEEGIFSPGKQGEEVIFPQLADLSLARLTLKNIPSQTEQEYKEWITPLNFLLRPGTQVTVVGEFKTREEAEFNYALVAFTDYLRASEESGVPRHYLVIIPTLTLTNLLEANKYEFNSQTDEVTIAGEDGQKTILELNQIRSEELTKETRKACGLYFVDQIKGELIKNPVVPYPQEMPSVWKIEEVKDEEGNVNLILRGQDQEGKFQDFSRARYDGEKEEWVWEKTVLPELTLEPGEVLIGKDFIGLPDEKILELLGLPENRGKITCPVNVDEKTEVKIAPIEATANTIAGGNLIAVTNFKEKNPQERILFDPSTLEFRMWAVPRDYGSDLNFRLDNGIMIKIANPEKVLVIAEAPDGKVKAKFGDVLATGFKNFPPVTLITEEQALRIYIPDPNNTRQFLKASEFMLKYKGRWVARLKVA